MYLESIASRYPRALPQGCPGSPTLHVHVHLRERLLMGAALAVLLRECRGVMSTSLLGERGVQCYHRGSPVDTGPYVSIIHTGSEAHGNAERGRRCRNYLREG